MKTTDLIIKKDSVFSKIKNFIVNLFTESKKEIYEENKVIISPEIENSFIKNDFYATNNKTIKRERLLKIQHDLENNIISIEKIPEEDFLEIVNLYEEQIKELKENTKKLNNSTNYYKEKIRQMLKASI